MDRPTDPVNTDNVPDTGDLIDPHAHDPRPQPVDDPDDPSYVEPAAAAVRVDPDRMVVALPGAATLVPGERGDPLPAPPPITGGTVTMTGPVEHGPPADTFSRSTASGWGDADVAAAFSRTDDDPEDPA